MLQTQRILNLTSILHKIGLLQHRSAASKTKSYLTHVEYFFIILPIQMSLNRLSLGQNVCNKTEYNGDGFIMKVFTNNFSCFAF